MRPRRPSRVAPVVIEIDVRARMLPAKALPEPIVAELPTCQNTLQDWAPPSVGFFLYYPSRRQTPASLQAFVDFLRAHLLNGAGA